MATDAPPPLVKRRRDDHPTLKLLGIGLLAAWVAFWVQSFGDFLFATLDLTWIPVWRFLGLDFFHCYLGVREWVRGMNPYLVDIGDFRGVGEFEGRYAAPPITLPLFVWTRWFDPYVATIIWISIIGAVMSWAVVKCMRVRRALGLWTPPLPLALAIILWSMPVLFSMERGNLDVWVLITLFIAMALMQRGGWLMEILAGVVLAVGAWTKIYPGLFVLAFLPFGRWKASLACFMGIVVIGVVPLDATRLFFRNAAGLDDNRVASIQEVVDWMHNPMFEPYRGEMRIDRFSHSLTSYWPLVFGKTPLGTIPGFFGAGAILGPVFLCGAYAVYRSRRRERLMLPFILWTLALGTYGLPISHDYNLFFLLLTALTLWDRRDPILIHVLMLSTLVWWQPLELPVVSRTAFIYLKFVALVPISILIVLRAREHGSDDERVTHSTTGRVPYDAPSPSAMVRPGTP